MFGGFEEHQSMLGEWVITNKYSTQFYSKNFENKLALKILTELYMLSSAVSWQTHALEAIVKIKDEIIDFYIPKNDGSKLQVQLNLEDSCL